MNSTMHDRQIESDSRTIKKEKFCLIALLQTHWKKKKWPKRKKKTGRVEKASSWDRCRRLRGA